MVEAGVVLCYSPHSQIINMHWMIVEACVSMISLQWSKDL